MKQIANIGLQTAADQAGISVRRARMWRKRRDESGEDGRCDRSSRPHVSPRRTSQDKQERILNLRRNHRLPYPVIACRAGVSTATVGAHLRACRGGQAATYRSRAAQAPLRATNARRNPASGYQKIGAL